MCMCVRVLCIFSQTEEKMAHLPSELTIVNERHCVEYIKLWFKGDCVRLTGDAIIDENTGDKKYTGPYSLPPIRASDPSDKKLKAIRKKYIDNYIASVIGVRIHGCTPRWGLHTIGDGELFLAGVPCRPPICKDNIITIEYDIFVTAEQLKLLIAEQDERTDSEYEVELIRVEF